MRVPEISLVNGLHAQNKHDLCRTISIQNDIDKLNTFQLTQFHLWWCQVCRAWEFRIQPHNIPPLELCGLINDFCIKKADKGILFRPHCLLFAQKSYSVL